MKLYTLIALIFCLAGCFKSPPKAIDSNTVDNKKIKVNLKVSAVRKIDESPRNSFSSPRILLDLSNKSGKAIELNQAIGQDELHVYLDSIPASVAEINCSALDGPYFCGYQIYNNIDYLIGQHQVKIELMRHYQLVASAEFELPGAMELTSPSKSLKSISTSDMPLLVEWATSFHPTSAQLAATNTQCGGEKDIPISSSQTYLELTLDGLSASAPSTLCEDYAKVSLNIDESSLISPRVISGFYSAQTQWDVKNILEFEISP